MSMLSPRKVIHTDEVLRTASDYLEYHVHMYVDTLVFISARLAQSAPRDLAWNATLESHLVHARLIIDFLRKPQGREDDVLAIDFFHDLPDTYPLPEDEFLKSWADNVGGRLVHITTKPMPALKSRQEWPIMEIAQRLKPWLHEFLRVVPDSRLVAGAREQCLSHLAKLKTQ
jgi:hypothetical protein